MQPTRYEILKMFRHTIKHGIRYPSKNRVEILGAVHEFYFCSKNLTDPDEIAERYKMAQMILANFKMYHAKLIELQTGINITEPYPEQDINVPGKGFVYF
jgi:hypothetical protein